MIQPKISVIIPVYNTEKYLEETLNSVVNQTIIEDIEVLMIDDGSTDSSGVIIEKYALNYDNFHAFHKENEGQAIARNYGLEIAKGEYVHFLDADDYIAEDTYEKMYDCTIGNDYDMIVCDVLRFNRYNCWESLVFKHSFEGFNESFEVNGIKDAPSFMWDAAIWNKIYKKEFLDEKNIQFPNEKIYFEDILFAFKCYANSNNFYFLNEILYFWRLRGDSTSITQKNDSYSNFNQRISILKQIKELIKENDLSHEDLSKLYERWLIHDIGMPISYINSFSPSCYDDLIDDILDIISIIPQDNYEQLNSYYKTMYEMIRNKDIDSLLYLTSLEEDLKNDPDLELKLSDAYWEMVDFNEDALDEELEVRTTAIDSNDENAIISFEVVLDYLSKRHACEINAFLIDETDNEEQLEIKNNTLIIPFDLIKNKKQVSVKFTFTNELFCKETFLINNLGRRSIIFENLDFEFAVGINTQFYINIRSIIPEEILVSNIKFEDNNFIFEGETDLNFDNVIMENVITFKKVKYPVIFTDNKFKFKIAYEDIIKPVIKKWEIKSDYLIKLSKSFEFYKDNDKVLIFNLRNIILLEDDLYNKFELLTELRNKFRESTTLNRSLSNENKNLKIYNDKYKSKIEKLKDKNSRLKEKNSKLKDKNSRLNEKNSKLKEKNSKLKDKNKDLDSIIKEYESRKVIKVADKLKFK